MIFVPGAVAVAVAVARNPNPQNRCCCYGWFLWPSSLSSCPYRLGGAVLQVVDS